MFLTFQIWPKIEEKMKSLMEEMREDCKAKTVVFNAVQNSGEWSRRGKWITGDITFDHYHGAVPTNVGNALNAENGVFTAPFNGTYEFNFAALHPENTEKTYPNYPILIWFVKTGVESTNPIVKHNIYHRKGKLSYQWMQELKAGDQLKLQVVDRPGSLDKLYVSESFPVRFTGQLVSLAN